MILQTFAAEIFAEGPACADPGTRTPTGIRETFSLISMGYFLQEMYDAGGDGAKLRVGPRE